MEEVRIDPKTLEFGILDENGNEINNPTPITIRTQLGKGESTDQRIKRILAGIISEQAAAQGHESIEEANDFNIDDDFDVNNPVTPYEMQLVHEETIQNTEQYAKEMGPAMAGSQPAEPEIVQPAEPGAPPVEGAGGSEEPAE